MNSDDVYYTIKKIASLSGNSKQEFLKVQNPGICRYLRAAYNPFVKFGVTSKACIPGKGQRQFDEYTWKVLNALAKDRLTGNAAIQTVKSLTFRMTPESSDLFGMILNGDFRMGMGAKTINKVYPGLIPSHDVMLAKLLDRSREKYPCWGSPKIDGVRSKFKNGRFYSRNGHEYIGLDHLQKQLSDITYELDGELIVPGVSFQVGSGWIRDLNPTPDAEFHIFELPTIKEPFSVRLIFMKDLHLYGSHIQAVMHEQLDKNHITIDDFYETCRNIGYEGAVIKSWDYEYKDARNYDWMKMKPTETVDLKVIELFEGKGKYEGQMGGAIVLFNGKPNKVGSGWSDYQRKYYYEHPEEIINKTIEIDYMEETDDGNMRHARFKTFREDKD